METDNCDVNAPDQSPNAGCGIFTSDTTTYGDGFNAQSGGVYVTEFTSSTINIWYFSRSRIPRDVKTGWPDPSRWGKPQAAFGSPCNIGQFIREQKLIFDLTFCGDWAGNVFSSNLVCAPKGSGDNKCMNFVQNNPTAFAESYWSIKSSKVYAGSSNTTSREGEPGWASIRSETSTGVSTSLPSEAGHLTGVPRPIPPASQPQSAAKYTGSSDDEATTTSSPIPVPIDDAGKLYITSIPSPTPSPRALNIPSGLEPNNVNPPYAHSRVSEGSIPCKTGAAGVRGPWSRSSWSGRYVTVTAMRNDEFVERSGDDDDNNNHNNHNNNPDDDEGQVNTQEEETEEKDEEEETKEADLRREKRHLSPPAKNIEDRDQENLDLEATAHIANTDINPAKPLDARNPETTGTVIDGIDTDTDATALREDEGNRISRSQHPHAHRHGHRHHTRHLRSLGHTHAHSKKNREGNTGQNRWWRI
jgi:hypothetical protein